MTTYKNLNGDSGVLKYEIGGNYILISFEKTGLYEYNYINVGEMNVETMKKLAKQGYGLNTYINDYLKDKKVSRIS
jgi:hypothetical protein